MTDYFAALDQPRRPWLEPEVLKEKFHELSAAVHPDRVHNSEPHLRQQAGERYAELNAAYQCLRNPKARLEHLCQLEKGVKPGDLRAIPNDVMQFFAEVGALLRETNGLNTEKAAVTSAILRVGLLEKSTPYLEKISKLQASIHTRLQEVTNELRGLDREWDECLQDPARRASALASVERLYHLFGFFERWAGQLQERSFQLTV
jgi:DnaJ-domain-containing protein 1